MEIGGLTINIINEINYNNKYCLYNFILLSFMTLTLQNSIF